MHLSMRMLYKTQLATTLSGVSPFTFHRPFSRGFVEKISNNGMLCVSLVVLISSGQNRLEFDL